MKKLLKHIFIIGIFFNITVNKTYSQFDTYLDLSSNFDDNLYLSPDKTGDLISDFDLRINYTPKDSNINLYYHGDYISFLNTSARNIYLNNFGVSYYKNFGDEKKHLFYMGGNLLTRYNKEEYNYYNYKQLYFYSNQRFNLNGLFLKTGYNFRYRGYEYFPDLTNYQHYLFLQANKSFWTRTSITLETDFGYKSFKGTETYINTSTNGGGGRRSSTTQTSVITNQVPSMSHFIVLARVAQSLHDRVGLYVQYRGQFSLTDEISYVNSDSYFQDEELFDDPFSYESSAFSSKLTLILPKSANLQIGGSFNHKSYISEPAFVSIDDTVGIGGNRIDDKQSIYLNFSKTFYLNKKRLNSLKTYVNYSYIVNESNSYWYNYKNNSVGVGVLINF